MVKKKKNDLRTKSPKIDRNVLDAYSDARERIETTDKQKDPSDDMNQVSFAISR